MTDAPTYPWRLDTNDRYRDVVSLVIGLSTAALLLPVFVARDILGTSADIPLIKVFTCSVYISWGLLASSIFLGVWFHIFSAKWVRLAWNQTASVFRIQLTENSCERWLEFTFWGTVLAFFGGLGTTIWFFVTTSSGG